MIKGLFYSVFFKPIFSLLVFIYHNLAFGSAGLAIIILTVLIRTALLPLFYKSAKDQTLMQKLRPKIEKIRKELKHDREKQAQALITLYKEHKLNPFSGFLILLVQLPIFIALFQIFRKDENLLEIFDSLQFLGFINLGKTSVLLVTLAAVLQYFQGKLSLSRTKTVSRKDSMASFNKTFLYLGSIFSFIILINLPSALALYWLVSTLFSIGQQFVINKKLEYINEDDGNTSSKDKKSDPTDGV